MTNLNIQIEELLQDKAPDFQIAKAIKTEIKNYLDSLDELFVDSSGKDFFVKHTKKIDGFIKVIYKYLLRKHFGSYLPMSNSIPMTIIALGSYGREQLCIYSDIDIMVLFDEVSGFNTKPIIEEFMVLAWDSGLKLGSRVHDIEEISQAVKTDVTIKTSILESRLIYGSKLLWYKYQNKLINIRNCEQKEFVIEKLDEHKQRLLKYPLTMQPNIKDGYGGMRESNMLFWMANITYGVSNTKELLNVLFTEDEYKKYRTALEYIFKVRNALHLIAKKKLDIVNLDILPDLSDKLGFRDTARLVKERQCMSKILQSLHTIHQFSSVMTKKITRRFLFDSKNFKTIKSNRISKNLYCFENKIFTSFNQPSKKLNLFLKEFISLPNNINSFDKSYLYYASKTILPVKTNDKTKSLIVSLLQKENLYASIKLLYNSRLLVQIIPTLKKIINQPQFDGYHKHPVDIHSIKTLYHIENIKDEFVLNMYNRFTLNQKFVLNLAAFFHDCGKGRGKDHHVVGQNLFRKFAKSLNISEENINLASLLIRYHNMMTKIATTEDIYSQTTILAFTGIIKSKEALELLYVLTYADINSVDSKLYKSSTSSLLKELYLQSIPAFDNKELLKISSRRVAKENTIKNHKLFIESSRIMKKKILNINSNQMFLKYKAEDIIKISFAAKDTEKFYFTLNNDNNLIIRITRAVPLNLGYLLGKIQFLNITSMGIYKLFDDKKFFEISFDSKLDNEDIPFVEQIIQDSFDMEKSVKLKKPNIIKEQITINCDHTDELALMKIETKDQKGLFSYIAKVFDDFDIEINSAKIQSNRGKANDLFLISKNGNFCSNKDEIVEILTNS
ncbi:MAG: HD domain-containing protein [Campylobacterota bacterium]|nr:HD domain-containing protein [Campylobacterota bacterium]